MHSSWAPRQRRRALRAGAWCAGDGHTARRGCRVSPPGDTGRRGRHKAREATCWGSRRGVAVTIPEAGKAPVLLLQVVRGSLPPPTPTSPFLLLVLYVCGSQTLGPHPLSVLG